MDKLYPPIIEGTLPAFYSTLNEDGTVNFTLTVPFSMNKSVPFEEITDFKIKVKTIQSNIYLLTNISTIVKWDKKQVSFTFNSVSKDQLNIGQFYKVQIAYVKNNIVGYYSNVGIIKYTSKPEVEIINLNDDINQHVYTYTGQYSQAQDFSEKVYSYIFNIYDEFSNLIATSGEQIHNTIEDTDQNLSIDTYTFNQDLLPEKIYYIEYKILTNNKLSISSKRYKIAQIELFDPYINTDIIALCDNENGYITITLKDKDEFITGDFKICRSSEEDNFMSWQEIGSFSLCNQKPSVIQCKDFNIKHGITYRYALQQYNSYGVFSNKSISVDICADFEHAFLFDGKRQLKIKYNPKLSSFKDILLETKTNTIGSKYPFIFRNGQVQYKEFTISGLISCWSDDQFLFVDEDFFSKFDYTVNLTNGNISTEREFKLEVLEWLNNGKPKLFKSPVEGNYIVRLLNISMSPTDTVGRMLHTFSATASEIADNSYENLLKYGFAETASSSNEVLLWKTVNLAAAEIGDNLLEASATSILLDGTNPFTQFQLDSDDILFTDKNGKYNIDIQNKTKYNNFKLLTTTPGLLTYTYYAPKINIYNTIKQVNILNTMYYFTSASDVKSYLNDNKRKVKNYYYIRATKKNTGNFTFILNDILIDISQTGIYEISNLKDITSLEIYDGINLEIFVQQYDIIYDFEEELNSWDNYIKSQQELQNAILSEEDNDLEEIKETAERYYQTHLDNIDYKLKELSGEGEENDLV